eukprot:TRINITY_DN2309_c0_g1_i1.p1 TRINITY_DN2309_c0_g1~~TRINITY_DN2309_c0_g1_i1.p1  ORF type:complete len:3326 (+),score=660.44 TRINITY_DN2309_c0_g1_i1:133-10110(+)
MSRIENAQAARQSVSANRLIMMRGSWRKYLVCEAPRDKREALGQFLLEFNDYFSSVDLSLLNLQFGSSVSLTQRLCWHFINEIGYLVYPMSSVLYGAAPAPTSPNMQILHDYLTGVYGNSEGPHVLFALDLLTQKSNTASLSGLPTMLVSLLSFMIPHIHSARPCKEDYLDYAVFDSMDPKFFSSKLYDESTWVPPFHIPRKQLMPEATDLGAEDNLVHAKISMKEMALVAWRLSSLLRNCTASAHLFDEIMKPSCLNNLLAIISSPPRNNRAVVTVYRMLVRVIGKIVVRACRYPKYISQLQAQQIVPRLVETLKKINEYPSVLSLELSQLIIWITMISSQYTHALMEDFDQNDGCDVILQNYLYVGEHGTTTEIDHFLHVINFLVYVLPPSYVPKQNPKAPEVVYEQIILGEKDIDGTSIRNLSAFYILLSAYQQSQRKELLTITLQSFRFFLVSPDNYARVIRLQPLKKIFSRLDGLDKDLQVYVLEIVEKVLETRREIPRIELESLGRVLSGARPRTALLVCNCIVRLMNMNLLSGDALRFAQVIWPLSEYLIPVADLTWTIEFMQSCQDQVSDSLELIRQYNLLDEIESLVPATTLIDGSATLPMIYVNYGIILLVLRVIMRYLYKNTMNQVAMRTSPALRQIYRLLTDDVLRGRCLEIVSLLAINDESSESSIVVDVVDVLHKNMQEAVLNPNVLLYRRDIMSAMCEIFRTNEKTKNAFRSAGGFLWALRMVGIVGNSIAQLISTKEQADSPLPYDEQAVFFFMETLMLMLASVLANHPTNQEYFKLNDGFVAIEAAIRSAGFLHGPYALGACDALIGISAGRIWRTLLPMEQRDRLYEQKIVSTVLRPVEVNVAYSDPSLVPSPDVVETDPSIPMLPLRRKYSVFQSPPHLTNTVSYQSISSILLARSNHKEIEIENPKFLTVLVRLLGNGYTKIHPKVILYCLQEISQLLKASETNIEILCNTGILYTTLESFERVIRDVNSVLQEYLLSFISSFARKSITLQELRRYLSYIQDVDKDLKVLDALTIMTNRNLEPIHYIEMPLEPGRFPYFESPALGEKQIPSISGYAVSFWIYFEGHSVSSKDYAYTENVIMTLASDKKCFDVTLSLHSGKLDILVNQTDKARFHEFTFKNSCWYHVIVSHQSFKGNKQSRVNLFIDGIMRSSQPLKYPAGGYTNLSVAFGSKTQQQKSWRLGNVYFIDDAVRKSDVVLLYAAGPNYSGRFEGDMSSYTCFDLLRDEIIQNLPEEVAEIVNPSQIVSQQLHDKIGFIFSARTFSIVQGIQVVRGLLVAETFSDKIVECYISTDSSSTRRDVRCVKDSIIGVGGIPLALSLLSRAHTSDSQRSALRFILSLIKKHPQNLKEMDSIFGYDIIALEMKRKDWVIDEVMVKLCFEFCGLAVALAHADAMAFCSGYLSNIAAFKALILDLALWRRAPLHVQAILYESIIAMLSFDQFSQFNIKRLQEIDASSTILAFLSRHDTLPEEIVRKTLDILRLLLHNPLKIQDLQALLTYIVTTQRQSQGSGLSQRQQAEIVTTPTFPSMEYTPGPTFSRSLISAYSEATSTEVTESLISSDHPPETLAPSEVAEVDEDEPAKPMFYHDDALETPRDGAFDLALVGSEEVEQSTLHDADLDPDTNIQSSDTAEITVKVDKDSQESPMAETDMPHCEDDGENDIQDAEGEIETPVSVKTKDDPAPTINSDKPTNSGEQDADQPESTIDCIEDPEDEQTLPVDVVTEEHVENDHPLESPRSAAVSESSVEENEDTIQGELPDVIADADGGLSSQETENEALLKEDVVEHNEIDNHESAHVDVTLDPSHLLDNDISNIDRTDGDIGVLHMYEQSFDDEHDYELVNRDSQRFANDSLSFPFPMDYDDNTSRDQINPYQIGLDESDILSPRTRQYDAAGSIVEQGDSYSGSLPVAAFTLTQGSILSKNPLAPVLRSDELVTVRIYVLQFLYDLLSSEACPQEIFMRFAELECPAEVLLCLLTSHCPHTNVILLRILNLYLRKPSLSAHMAQIHGFNVMAHMIKNHAFSEALTATLFEITLDDPNYLYQRVSEMVQHNTKYTRRVLLQPKHPSCFIPVLATLRNCEDHNMKHVCLSSIWDVISPFEAVRVQLMKDHFLDFLAELVNEDSHFFDIPSYAVVQHDIGGLLRIFAQTCCHISITSKELVNPLDDLIQKFSSKFLNIADRRLVEFTQRQIIRESFKYLRGFITIDTTTIRLVKLVDLCVLSVDLAINWFDIRQVLEQAEVEFTIDRREDHDAGDQESKLQFIDHVVSVFCTLLEKLPHGSIADSQTQQSRLMITNNILRLLLHVLRSGNSAEDVMFALNQLKVRAEVLEIPTDEETTARIVDSTYRLLNTHEFPEYQSIAQIIFTRILRARKSYTYNLLNKKSVAHLITALSKNKPIHATDFLPCQLASSFPVLLKKVEEKVVSLQRKREVARSDRLSVLSKEKATRDERMRNTIYRMTNRFFAVQHERSRPWTKKAVELSEKRRAVYKNRQLFIREATSKHGVWSCLGEEKVHWKLDPSEGVNRKRVRLRRSYYNFPNYPYYEKRKRYDIENDDGSQVQPPAVVPYSDDSDEELMSNLEEELYEDAEINLRMIVENKEKVVQCYKCALIQSMHKKEGELLICEQNAYFIPEKNMKPRGKFSTLVIWPYAEIAEIHRRRYLMRNDSLEIFLTNGRAYLITFPNLSDRDEVRLKLLSFNPPHYVDYEEDFSGGFARRPIYKKWQDGEISNFEYLMHLNTLAGRSFNDFTQYPVFPFLIADYTSKELDLKSTSTFRDLTKPMGAQDPQRLQKFMQRFEDLEESGNQPYHYGSHYSNVGSVLHFLLRLEPYTQYFVELQSGHFDLPDRMFYSIEHLWNHCSSGSMSDVKELIPEFFYLSDFFINKNNFYLGVKQDGEIVNDVGLPPWAPNARIFVRKHLQALESAYVSENLHSWIDLIFGYKQTGRQALESKNLFHPLTYEGAVDLSTMTDVIQREATVAQITNYGQAPKQLFKRPHPERRVPLQAQSIITDYQSLNVADVKSTSEAVYYMHYFDDLKCLGARKVVLLPDSTRCISWGYWDQSLRMMATDGDKFLSVFEPPYEDDMLCAAVPSKGRQIFFGGVAGVVWVWDVTRNRGRIDLNFKTHLNGHASSITCIAAAQDFNILVTGSNDRTCILWDLSQLRYLRSLEGHAGPVNCVSISPTTGDIVTADTSESGATLHFLRLWSVNGDAVASQPTPSKTNTIIFTRGVEGIVENLIFTGHESGDILIWHSWDLAPLMQLNGAHTSPIISLCTSNDMKQLYSGDKTGKLVTWNCNKREPWHAQFFTE